MAAEEAGGVIPPDRVWRGDGGATTFYTADHEYLRLEGGIATVGVTAYAARLIGEVVSVRLPAPGAALEAGAEAASVETVKAASEVGAPAAGEVVAVNEALADSPATVSADPEGAGWLFRMRLSRPTNFTGLMDAAAYAAHLRAQEI